MATQNADYYRQRAEEEMAAAEQADDPSISNIHREMARRYYDMLSSGAGHADGDPMMAEPGGEAIAEPRAAFG